MIDVATTQQQDLDLIKQDFTALGAPLPQANVPATVTVTNQAQRDRANALWLRTQQGLKLAKAAIKSVKDEAKAALEKALAPHLVEQQLLEVMDGALERAIIKYDDEVAAAAAKEQERLKKLYDKRVETAEKKAEATGNVPVLVVPPPVVAVPMKTQTVQGLGSSTVKVDYTYDIPGCAAPGMLRRSDPAGEKIPEKYWRLEPPKLHRDDMVIVDIIKENNGPCESVDVMKALPLSWFVLDLDLVSKTVRGSKGEQLIPGIVIKERKGLAGRLA